MPKVFERNGYKFFFFSNEGNPRESVHIHVRKGEKLAKFWLKPNVKLEDNYGFNSKELNWIEEEIEKNLNLIEGKWNDFFGI
ncbi:hypothetical protein BEN44_17020 [Leptospira interrogans serovar Ricardi]|uniref:DUF4160 domain-containing protein n=1 Tax=Leptospira interrogans TaxID=173 RepID=UPI002158B165|nr:DUF4160 domain-containing protein [Leptospira interrogans]MCR8640274.1 hypothetical protein [Leptospira interrogans serovar Ricardi]